MYFQLHYAYGSHLLYLQNEGALCCDSEGITQYETQLHRTVFPGKLKISHLFKNTTGRYGDQMKPPQETKQLISFNDFYINSILILLIDLFRSVASKLKINRKKNIHTYTDTSLLELQICVGLGPPPWFRNSKFYRGGVVNLTPNPQPGGPEVAFRLAPYPFLICGDAAMSLRSANIALRVIRARKPPSHDKGGFPRGGYTHL
jgi:hypothetical protein